MQRLLTKIWILGFLLVSLICYSVLLYHVIALKSSLDFVLLYHFAKNFISSHDLYAAIPWREYYFPRGLTNSASFSALTIGELSKTFSPNLNPPSFAFFIFPLGFLSYRIAFVLWSIINFFFAAWGVRILYKNIFSEENVFGYLIILGIFFGSIIGFSNISLGEVGVVCFLCLVGIWYYARNHQDIPAGILLGLLLSDKYSFGLLAILFLCQKRWKIIFSALGVFLFLNGLAYGIIGKTAFVRYAYVLHQIAWYASNWNASLPGFTARFGIPSHINYFSPPWFGVYFYFACSAFLLYLFFKKSFQKISTPNDYDYAFCYALFVGFILCPLSWIYYLNILCLPALLIIRAFASKSNISLNTILWLSFSFGLLLYPNSLDVNVIHPLAERLGQDSLHFYGLILFFILWCYYEKSVKSLSNAKLTSTQLAPWAMLAYLVTMPSMIFLFYIVFLRAPKVWM